MNHITENPEKSPKNTNKQKKHQKIQKKSRKIPKKKHENPMKNSMIQVIVVLSPGRGEKAGLLKPQLFRKTMGKYVVWCGLMGLFVCFCLPFCKSNTAMENNQFVDDLPL